MRDEWNPEPAPDPAPGPAWPQSRTARGTLWVQGRLLTLVLPTLLSALTHYRDGAAAPKETWKRNQPKVDDQLPRHAALASHP